MPDGFFPAVEPDAPARPLLERLRPAVDREIERHAGCEVTVHAELRTSRSAGGDVDLARFYWSSQRADPRSPFGFSARTLFCAGPSAETRLHEFPSEPALGWLDADPGPLRHEGRPERVDILRYIPLRRLTFRLHDGQGLPPRVIAKAKRTSGLNRAATAFLAVHLAASRARSAGVPRVPQLVRMEPPRHALYLEELPGRPLGVAIRDLDTATAMTHLGAVHRSLQGLEVRGLTARRTIADWLEDARTAVAQVGLFVPSAAHRAQGLYDELERTAPGDVAPLFCQGDFLPGQIRCHESGWGVIDFDDSRWADPLSEVAAMYVAMPRELGLSREQADQARRTYLAAYAERAGDPFDEDRWRWFLVALELAEHGKRLMKGRVAPGETHAVLERLAEGEDAALR